MAKLYRKVTLKHLKLISVLGQELNMSSAAEKLHTSLPALSRSLSQLEQQLNLTLFDRTTRSIELTSAGHSLLHYANTILSQLEQAEQELEGISRGKITIGIIPAFSPDLLATSIHQLRIDHPEIKIDIHTKEANELYQMLLDGSVDIMLSHAEFSADFEKSTIHELYQEASTIVCCPNSQLSKLTNIGIADIIASPWILPKPNIPLRVALNRTLFVDRPVNKERPNDIETDSYEQSLAILKNSEMLTVLPGQLASKLAQDNKVYIIQAKVPLLKGPMCFITSKKMQPNWVLEKFQEIIQSNSRGLSKPASQQ